jgi:hypothetical protein
MGMDGYKRLLDFNQLWVEERLAETAGCRTSRTAPSGTRPSWPLSPTRRRGRGGWWS